ncbi:MAG: DUF1365 domain-containing protein [Bacteroidetes bacterium]|nr:DUF1365 domain-containing protein [Bacteroidota bacterium]
MNSCLYKATVMHHRTKPVPHRFHYNVFMFYIDLDELDMLTQKFKMISRNRFNFFSFRDSEHLQLPVDRPDTTKTTKEHITDYIRSCGITDEISKVMLLTNLNVLGYNFNPVSFYYCYNAQNQPLCAIAEVSNTFREMKPYLLNADAFNGEQFQLNTTKYFYVSPFIDHDANFDFRLSVPGEKLNIRIDDIKDDERFFISTLTGQRRAMTNRALFSYSVRFPFITLLIITRIHWHALRLWLKKLPFHRKAEHGDLQRDVFRKYEKNKVPK